MCSPPAGLTLVILTQRTTPLSLPEIACLHRPNQLTACNVDRHLQLPIPAHILNDDLITDFMLLHQRHEVVDRFHWLSVHGNENVTQLNTSPGGFS